MKNLTLKACLAATVSLSALVTVQAQDIEAVAEKPITKTSVENQVNAIFNNSAEQNDVKMVRKTDLENLRFDVVTLLSRNENDLADSKKTIESKNGEIKNLTAKLDEAKAKEATFDTANETFLLFGMPLSKVLYHSIMWSLVSVLLIFAVFLGLRFKGANSITKDAKEKLTEVEEEFEQFKRNAIEREQKLRRQLQDEINKQKKKLVDVS
ncbi:MAG TPA: hypothetical protein VLB74_05895 [Flavobacterium sp.]|uniref:tRNA (guanine-N1)-methyltransferase n=1 Tax=Flavobacterium sp. TaxID=239 RepID=UPI002BA7048F|nr:tRNA (guanine-N1)-methyltransferase [Flavobacterium sp.]HSD14159.1 hypothetical protein [Flavobacterium sp.]